MGPSKWMDDMGNYWLLERRMVVLGLLLNLGSIRPMSASSAGSPLLTDLPVPETSVVPRPQPHHSVPKKPTPPHPPALIRKILEGSSRMLNRTVSVRRWRTPADLYHYFTLRPCPLKKGDPRCQRVFKFLTRQTPRTLIAARPPAKAHTHCHPPPWLVGGAPVSTG